METLYKEETFDRPDMSRRALLGGLTAALVTPRAAFSGSLHENLDGLLTQEDWHGEKAMHYAPIGEDTFDEDWAFVDPEYQTEILNEDIGEENPSVLLEMQARFGNVVWVSRVLSNRIAGESVRFLRFEDGSMKWLYRAEPGSKVPFAHRHVEELYEVLDGEIKVWIEDEVFTGRGGENIVIPEMALHYAWNESDAPVNILVSFDAGEEMNAMSKAFWLVCDKGYVKKDGSPEIRHLIPAMRETKAVTYPKITGIHDRIVKLFVDLTVR